MMSMALALVCQNGLAATERNEAEKRVAELKFYLAGREHVLASVGAERKAMLKQADSLAGRVESQKEKEDRSWFEQRAVEKNMARLRTLLQEIQELSAREQDVLDEALAAAAALVAEIEDVLEKDLVELRRNGGGDGKGRKVEGVLALEKERKIYQAKLNSLMPSLELPLDLPPGVSWTKEMIEDQRRAYEASMARLQAEKQLLLQEKRLRGLIKDAVPGVAGAESEGAGRIEARIADLDRKLTLCRDKLARIDSGRKGRN